MNVHTENLSGGFDKGLLYTRADAERILSSIDVRPLHLDLRALPIAGLRSISSEGAQTIVDVPHEILSPQYTPVVLCDLDEIAWKHAQAVVKAVGKKTGKPITMAEYGKIGNTRRVPGWNDEAGTKVQDAIIGGRDPDYYPYVNTAYPGAVSALLAQEKMGHRFAYLTGRPASVIPATLRVLEWNGLPIDSVQKEYVDALSHEEPRQGWVYGADGMPMLVGRTLEHKQEVVKHWLSHLRNNGWKGQLVVVDDLPGAYGTLLELGKITAISLTGDVNRSRNVLPKEQRVSTWEEIQEKLMSVHEQAVASDPSPYRRFKHYGKELRVLKNASGNGVFRLEDMPAEAYKWIDEACGVQEAFERLSR